MEKSVEIAAIETAMATLLAGVDERRHAVLATIDHPHDTKVNSPVADLIDDPVGQSLRFGIRRLGERLSDLDGGRTDLMHQVVLRVCRDKRSWAESIGSSWLGIGDWQARPGHRRD